MRVKKASDTHAQSSKIKRENLSNIELLAKAFNELGWLESCKLDEDFISVSLPRIGSWEKGYIKPKRNAVRIAGMIMEQSIID